MKSLYQYIVKPINGKLYDNVRNTGNGEIIVSTNIENHEVTNRVAVVESPPLELSNEIRKGALIIVHHNVFRKYNDIKGNEKFASGLIFGDYYLVDPYQVYMYKNTEDDDWTAIDPFCFVSPINNDDELHTGSEKELHGRMEYPSKYLKSIGISSGDIVGFRTDSEYEFNIDGKKYYRVNSNNICSTT